MKTDSQLKKDVVSELEWDPAVNATHVGVAVKNGVVTLAGHLETLAEKFAVERAVQRVQGVKALAVELDVKLSAEHERSDSEIAAAAEEALMWHAEVPNDRLQVHVENGWITLKGDVEWEYQRNAAKRAVQSLVGVRGVSNNLSLKVHPMLADIGARIREALERHAKEESKHIEVVISGATAILRGKVHSWAERAAAQGAAWAAPGVSSVVNELKVAD